MRSFQQLLGIGLLAASTFALAGCGSDGPQRFRVTGEVTWQGKPVPAGMITFTPDGRKGNSGPQGAAPIRDGRFDTDDPQGRGTVGGAQIIAILGYDGSEPTETDPLGKRLFPEYQLERELPKEDTTLDVTVP